jgi:hypothetical protein
MASFGASDGVGYLSIRQLSEADKGPEEGHTGIVISANALADRRTNQVWNDAPAQ